MYFWDFWPEWQLCPRGYNPPEYYIGHVCEMYLCRTVERAQLVKFGRVVFVDKLTAQRALKIGKIFMQDGFEVLLKEVPKPWLTS